MSKWIKVRSFIPAGQFDSSLLSSGRIEILALPSCIQEVCNRHYNLKKVIDMFLWGVKLKKSLTFYDCVRQSCTRAV